MIKWTNIPGGEMKITRVSTDHLDRIKASFEATWDQEATGKTKDEMTAEWCMYSIVCELLERRQADGS